MPCDNFYGLCLNGTVYKSIDESIVETNKNYIYYILGIGSFFTLLCFGFIYNKYLSKVQIERNEDKV